MPRQIPAPETAITQLVDLAEQRGWDIDRDLAARPEFAVAASVSDTGYSKVEVSLSEVDDDLLIVEMQRIFTRPVADTSDLAHDLVAELLDLALALCPGETDAERGADLLLRLHRRPPVARRFI